MFDITKIHVLVPPTSKTEVISILVISKDVTSVFDVGGTRTCILVISKDITSVFEVGGTRTCDITIEIPGGGGGGDGRRRIHFDNPGYENRFSFPASLT